jgi:hypothetical protein
MKQGRMHRKEGPAGGQRGSLFKGPDTAGRLPGFIPSGEGWQASRCGVMLGLRSARYAPLAFLASLAWQPSRGPVEFR